MTKVSTSTTSAQAAWLAVQLLGGAQRKRIRPRGFAPWSPQGATLRLLDQVRGVLANILRSAIEERVDQRVLDRVLRQERRTMLAKLRKQARP